ncbi:gamma-glutamyltransferase [Arenicella xantha]|uniref:Glutathione hydrolase proenzyme n=1 Tax=Arenicella xantha TaxID=644221 RepID=A0A395JPT3_9GAMM|nr:gamma-glutamyltransferase [Arenicella xantha]RBP53353.1 gamma-glutamyltranspeptidase/glutathione hydrolase [Arenicella xantha]
MRTIIGLLFVIGLTACGVVKTPLSVPPGGVDAKQTQAEQVPAQVISQGMVVTANPHASKVGADILRAGGSAVDAAIAIEAVLSLVEPQSSGLAGGGFMLYFDNKTNQITVYDGRETAPANAKADMFLNQDGESIGYLNAKHSGLSTGVPGVVSLLQLAHEDHGKLPWGAHFERAIQLAEEGFEISPRLHSFIQRFGKYIPAKLADGPVDAYQYFFDANGEPRALGSKRTNLAYAKTLRILAQDPAAFYHGEIAQEIVEQVGLLPRAGSLTLADMAAYKAQRHQPLCKRYQSKRLCGPPPSSSWVAVGMIAGLLESVPAFSVGGADDSLNWSIFADAQRLAYADRDQYVADEQFVEVPLSGLLDQRYLDKRAEQIQRGQAIQVIAPGDPWPYEEQAKVAYGLDATNDVAGTTHFVVVDGDGNVVSMTASVESIFGSTRMAGGMFLNNQLTDFSFTPRDESGQLIANRVEPGKRPRSSMSPTIVLDANDEFYMATGSPGGNSIIAYTAKTLVGVIDWGLSPQQAVNLPNMVARGDSVRIEKDRATDELIAGLRKAGFEVKESAGENSGLSVIVRQADGRLQGGVDPRREGVIEVVDY